MGDGILGKRVVASSAKPDYPLKPSYSIGVACRAAAPRK
jgi:hypothetical protein